MRLYSSRLAASLRGLVADFGMCLLPAGAIMVGSWAMPASSLPALNELCRLIMRFGQCRRHRGRRLG